MLGVPGGEHGLVLGRQALDLDFAVLPELQRILTVGLRILRMELPHVVRVHEPAGFVESSRWWTRVRLVADVPFPEYGGLVRSGLQGLAQGGETRVEPPGPRSMCAEDFGPARITAAEQRRARRGTDRLRHVEIVKPAALARKALDIGCLVGSFAEWPEVGPAGVV